MTRALDVLVDGKLIGYLYDKDPLAFAYSDDVLNGLLRSPFPSVIALVPGDIATPAVLAYFENLLPEGDQRRTLEEKHHATSVFGLLWTAGWDTAGAIVLQPSGSDSNVPAYVKSSWTEIAQIIAGHGLPRESSKASISGAQYKLLLCLDEQANPLLPVGSTPSTHILKPDIERTGQKIWASAINETIIMRAARKCGLPIANVDYVAAVKSCLVERYDRLAKNGVVIRVHQSDLCQLLKTASGVKYEVDGGPNFAACYARVKSLSANPLIDCANLLKWLFFNLYVGNNDSHAKNVSMLSTSDGERLAPFYDLMTTTVYPGFSTHFALSIGGTFKPEEIGHGELKDLADSLNVSERYMLKLAKEMADLINPAIKASILELQAHLGHSEKIMAERLGHEVASICKKRSVRFLARSASPLPDVGSTAKDKRVS